MVRRCLALVLCAILAGTVAPAVAAPPKACPAFADAKKDAFANGQKELAPTADQTLDITSVKYKAFRGKGLSIAITVAKYTARPAFAPGNRFQAEFTMNKRPISIYYKTSPTRSQEENVFYQAGIRDGDTFLSPDVTATIVGNTLTMNVSSIALKGALGSKAIGSQITGLRAVVYGSYVARNLPWDTAAAPRSMKYVIGAACR